MWVSLIVKKKKKNKEQGEGHKEWLGLVFSYKIRSHNTLYMKDTFRGLKLDCLGHSHLCQK